MTWDGSSIAEDVTFGYARDISKSFNGESGGFYKLALAMLVLKSPMPTVANFTVNVTNGPAPLAVQFNDTSTGSPPTAWAWDFDGDNNPDSTDQNATHIFTAAGNYSVNLTVTSAWGTNTTIRSGLINVTGYSGPVANFTNITPRSGTGPLIVLFSDTSTGSPTAWNWSFGDISADNTSTLKNPSHTYETPGTYSVNLSVIGPGGTNFTVKENYISVDSPAGLPVAAFSATPLSGPAPLNVSFTDLSTGSPTEWAWDFNNDTIIDNTTQNPEYTFSSPGTYAVKLNVTNSLGSDNVTRIKYITVYSGDVVISMEPDVVRLNNNATQEIRIVMDNAPAGLSGYNMTVSLGTQGIAEIVNVSYPSWAQLTKTPLLPDTTIMIGGTDTGHQIIAGSANITLATITVRGNLTGMTPVSINTIYMDDDGYPIGSPSKLINPILSDSMVTVGAYSGPIANFTANTTAGTAPLTIRFTDTSENTPTNWSWDFNNDGNVDSWLQSPECTYTDTGTYTVNLTVTNADGSHSRVKPSYITVTASTTPPVASFSGTPLSGNAPLTVTFTDTSTGSPTGWSWQFGDGNTSSQQSPTFTYNISGTYTVRLTATNGAGSNTAVRTDYVTVANAYAPVASFTANPSYGTVPLTVTFTDTSTGKPTSWTWDFGDGNTSVLRNNTVTYTSPGIYTVTHTARNSYGVTTATNIITVNTASGVPGVAFSASPTFGAAPLAVSFTDASSGGPDEWTWDFGDGSYSSSRNPSHEYSSVGTYDVTLSATNDAGTASLTKTQYISVTSSSTPSDLSVYAIVPNPGTVSAGSVFALEQNPVLVRIRNSGSGDSVATTVNLVSGDGFSGTATVPAIAADGTQDVAITDTKIRQTASGDIKYTATVDPDKTVSESNENNNALTGTFNLRYNGYKGKRYWNGGNDIVTRQYYDLKGGLAWSTGDSQYRSGSFGEGGWLSYTVNWAATEPSIPTGSTVKAAYLYVPYTWDNEHIAPDHVFIDFNGQRVIRTLWNYDKSNFGVYADYEYGLLKYDVTSLYKKNDANSAVFTRENPKYSDPAEAAVLTKLSMNEFFLVVVYEDTVSTRKQIFINDNYDLLGASSDYGTTSAESTAYIPFTGMTIDTANMDSATLYTFVAFGDSHEGNILYNGNVIASNVWDWGGTGTGSNGGKQVAVDTRDVKSYIQSSNNVFGIQSTDHGGTPCMGAIQQFLVIDLGSSSTTTTTTTTATTKETIVTIKPDTVVTLSSGAGASGGGTGSGSSVSGGAGVSGQNNPSSPMTQGNRYQAGPVEQTDMLDGEDFTANAADPLRNLPFKTLLSGLFFIGATCAVAYRQGMFPYIPAAPVPSRKHGQCIWDGSGTGASCQVFSVTDGTIRYRTPGRIRNISRAPVLLAGIIICGILVSGAAWAFETNTAGSALHTYSAGDILNGNFDLIPTIEGIRDLDTKNRAPDYPPGFSARNGILFVYHGTESHPVADIELQLSKGTNSIPLTPTSAPPAANAVGNGFSTYFEEMGNGDGMLDPDEWLMVYADNCYDSSQADGEPRGKVLVWQPQGAMTALELPLKDSAGYSLKDTSDGTILQQGTVLFVPATT